VIDGVHRAVAAWHPYAGLVYLHLLLDRLAALGYVPEHDGSAPRTASGRDEGAR
jgi:hypothetical protein